MFWFQTPPEVNGVSTTEIIRTGLTERGEKVRLDEVRSGSVKSEIVGASDVFYGARMWGGDVRRREEKERNFTDAGLRAEILHVG